MWENVVIIMCIRYYDYFHLYLSAQLIPKDTSFISTNLFKTFSVEVFINIFHPNIITKNMKFTTNTTWNNIESHLDVNDIFSSITLLRFYLVFWSLISFTRFYGARINRVR